MKNAPRTADEWAASFAEDRKPGGKVDQLKAHWMNLTLTPCDCSQYATPIAGQHNRDAHTPVVN